MATTYDEKTSPLGDANAHHGTTKLGQKLRDAAVPANNFAVKMGSESFLPMAMDQECDKAARILQSFCGMSSDPSSATTTIYLGTEDEALPLTHKETPQ